MQTAAGALLLGLAVGEPEQAASSTSNPGKQLARRSADTDAILFVILAA
jgi:hypothetical protein